MGFVPLRGFPYISFPRRYGGSGEHSEPMGALVPCDHFCRYEDLQLASMAPPPAHCVCHLPRLGRGGWRYAPSPYGDMVLKFSQGSGGDRPLIVSVPLRGYTCLASPVATGEVASNASRWGRLCLACTSVAMDSLRLASMAPPPAHCVCHLPRSARGGWRYAPSPCGDMVLK